MVNQVQLSYALADYHYDAVGVLAIDPTGEYLLSGGKCRKFHSFILSYLII